MAWMLQPHNWTQAVRPNLYNVAYGRTDTYKGMGAVYSHIRGGFRGLGQQDQSSLPLTLDQSSYIQANFPTVAAFDPAAGAGGMISATTPTTTTNWPLIIGAGLLVLLLLRGR